MPDKIIGYTLAAALPVALAWIAIIYLQRTLKRGMVAGAQRNTSGLEGVLPKG